MNSKSKTLLSAWIAGVSGFLGWLATLPPETMTGMFAIVEQVFPPAWRAQIGAVLKLIALFSGIYASVHAARSGPQTPPANTKNE